VIADTEEGSAMITRVLPVLAVCLLAAVAPGPPDAVRDESKQLQGVWEVVGFEADGVGEDELLGSTVVFSEKTLRIADLPEMRYRIDSAKEPKWFDATAEATEETPFSSGMAGIYKLEENTLTICYSPRKPGWVRPSEFKTAADSRAAVLVLKRAKRGGP